MKDPQAYAGWYETPRGAWIGQREQALLKSLLQPQKGKSLLDVGCGTGYFTAGFVAGGLQVTGIDMDPSMLAYARRTVAGARFLQADMGRLPFPDGAFDYVCAVTSLCFVADPLAAVREMWRVSRSAVVLGLLNRHSLLYLQKRHSDSYAGARWDSPQAVRQWARSLSPPVRRMSLASGIFLPGAGHFARAVEHCLPATVPLGGFLAVVLNKQ